MNLKVFIKHVWAFTRYRLGTTIGSGILLTIIILGFIVSLFAPYDPRRWNQVPRDCPPSFEHPLGTTSLGQDVFWFLTHAIRNSIILGVIGSAVGLLIGATLGLIAGYKGGTIDKVILLFADTFIILPGLPLLILLSSLVKSQLNVFTLGLIIAFLTWGPPVRNVRSIVLSLREREFTYTAIFSGLSIFKIIFSEYLPHIMPWILASFISRILMAIGMEVTLAIFGLSSLTEATLGTMIYWALQYQALLRGIWWWISTPVITIVILFLSLYLVSMGITEYLNPRARLRRIMIGGGS